LDSAVLQCGPGTVEVDGECVPVELECGFGTVIEGEECVALDKGIPCGLVEKDVVYTISGATFAPEATRVTISQLHVESDTWFHTCVDVDAEGRFQGDISWDSSIFPHRGYLMVAAADDDCEPLQPWDISMRIALAEPGAF
jgi:hypothetical protein